MRKRGALQSSLEWPRQESEGAKKQGSERGVSAEEGREKEEEDWKREGNGGF